MTTDSSDFRNQVSPASELAQVLLITNEMLLLAQQGSWDAITELEQRRREMLTECFSSPIPSSRGDVFAEALAAMLHMNEEMIDLLDAAKEKVAIKRTDQRHRARSLAHYLDVEESQ